MVENRLLLSRQSSPCARKRMVSHRRRCGAGSTASCPGLSVVEAVEMAEHMAPGAEAQWTPAKTGRGPCICTPLLACGPRIQGYPGPQAPRP